jgi:hypothetical protein
MSALFRVRLAEDVQQALEGEWPVDVLGTIADYLHERTLPRDLQRDIEQHGNRSRAWHMTYAQAGVNMNERRAAIRYPAWFLHDPTLTVWYRCCDVAQTRNVMDWFDLDGGVDRTCGSACPRCGLSGGLTHWDTPYHRAFSFPLPQA